jgi:hypothetical protein
MSAILYSYQHVGYREALSKLAQVTTVLTYILEISRLYLSTMATWTLVRHGFL